MEEASTSKVPQRSPVRKNKRGQLVHSNQKLIIINLYKTLNEKNPNILRKDVVAKVVEETGIGSTTIRNTLMEYEAAGTVTSPNKKKRRLSFKEKIDECDKNAIRRKVHEFYMKEELPTLQKVLQAVNDDENLPNYKRSTFHLLLKELQFTFTIRHCNSILTEREDLIIWRRKYLKAIKRYREEGRSIYYLDETWINASDVTNKVWMDETIKSKKDPFLRGLTTGPTNPSGKGKRLIILHIGSVAGFVPGGLLCFESKKHTDDYHDEMNEDTFLEWWKNILPLLDDNAVIVMDNAPYHSMKTEKLPNASWRKAEIIQWLENKGKETSDNLVKAELLHIANQHKDRYDKYVVDELAQHDNKTVLRLPPYHCELNPIEMVWSMVKGYVKSNNSTFKLKDVKLLLEQGIEWVTADHWRNFIRHVKNEEKKMWEVDHIADSMIDATLPLIINVTGETISETSSTSSTSKI
ncbi:hypothetical protein X777_12359 [Ooceraea biroi]|uniref:Tc1-like transposase DDE domain-containing protein n=1 Tax=Ooceraea biroi TaxID=2015173 RepID=A0A026W2S1_OOCBI|nr:hypothetical protein X777_12359 [Ooceraea biroi]